ncbi:hypothetical protein TWF506_008077 [Arthrobotrys conoides]|uniref:Uncharacterized protein n=1 Tax=Arthrobotrys conoides TaxID=74498 RepID=A0AAN8NV95_9PEZI
MRSSIRLTICVGTLLPSTTLSVPLNTIRSVNIKDISAYASTNGSRLEALWDSLVDFQEAIQSHPIGLDPIATNLVPAQNIFGTANIFAENDSKPIPTLLGMIASAKAQVKTFLGHIPELEAEYSPLMKDPGFDNEVLDITDQQRFGVINLKPVLSDIPDGQNPPLLGSDQGQNHNQDQSSGNLDLDAGFVYFAEDAEDSDSGGNPNDQVFLDISNNLSPPLGVVEGMINTLETLYSALTKIEDLKADIQPDFFSLRKQWRIDGFVNSVWETLSTYYHRVQHLQNSCTVLKEKCSLQKGLTTWVFNWHTKGHFTMQYNGLIDLGGKQDLEEGNMDLAVAIKDAMKEYKQALYKAFESVFLDAPKRLNNVRIDGLKNELMMIYDYMAVYEENLRIIAANIKVLDGEWGTSVEQPQEL